uniref:Uncharacterized protein n=1 Tax=Trypanosoma vivax (strain Y486) TaxID=1055687 RepID=G0TVB6_TRYVY|nr:hypothetical protein, unlikely [Trypanosoma vivax Y486]
MTSSPPTPTYPADHFSANKQQTQKTGMCMVHHSLSLSKKKNVAKSFCLLVSIKFINLLNFLVPQHTHTQRKKKKGEIHPCITVIIFFCPHSLSPTTCSYHRLSSTFTDTCESKRLSDPFCGRRT